MRPWNTLPVISTISRNSLSIGNTIKTIIMYLIVDCFVDCTICIASGITSWSIRRTFRCVHITDIGIGYISTMLALNTLYLRWCTQIRDFGLQHICGMRSMQILSLAGIYTLYRKRSIYFWNLRARNECRFPKASETLSEIFYRFPAVLKYLVYFSGCPLLTSTGMSNLIQLRHLQELELTNCPGATPDLIEYLRQNLPKCLVLD